MRGRRPTELNEVLEQAEGSPLARERATVIAEVLLGQCSVKEACARLEVGETRFRQLRDDFVQGGLASLEPGKAGRPSRQSLSAAEENQALVKRVQELELQLHAAQVREEIALILPGVSNGNGTAEEKKRAGRR